MLIDVVKDAKNTKPGIQVMPHGDCCSKSCCFCNKKDQHCSATANDNNVNDFARAFGHAQASAALQQKAEDEFLPLAQHRAETRRQKMGDACDNDGDNIFVNQGSAACAQMAPNHGQT